MVWSGLDSLSLWVYTKACWMVLHSYYAIDGDIMASLQQLPFVKYTIRFLTIANYNFVSNGCLQWRLTSNDYKIFHSHEWWKIKLWYSPHIEILHRCRMTICCLPKHQGKNNSKWHVMTVCHGTNPLLMTWNRYWVSHQADSDIQS